VKCSCGQLLTGEGGVIVCSSCQRQNLTCSECGANLTIPPDAVVAQCLYCATPLQHIDLSSGTPYFTVSFSAAEARAQLLTFLLNRFGIPDDFAQQFQAVEQRLVYVPVYLYRVTAWLTPRIYETDSKAVIATRGIAYRDVLDRYRFAIRAKVYADPRTIRGQVYPQDVARPQADQEAWQFGSALLQRDRLRFDEVPGIDQIQCDFRGSVFYPLYEIAYRYGSRTFYCVFDACNGVVCKAAHPQSRKARAAIKFAGVLYLVFAAVIALLFFMSGLLLGDVGIGVSSFGAAAIVIGTAIAVGGRILWSSGGEAHTGEEIDVGEQPLVVKELTCTLPVTQRKSMVQQQAPPQQQHAVPAGGHQAT